VGTLVVQDTIDKVRVDLVDEDAVTWTDADLVESYNEAVRLICNAKPDAYTINGLVALIPGTVQTLPAGATGLISLIENQGSLRRITQCDLELLDETYRFWPAGTQATDVEHFTFDPRLETQFRVYPPNDGDGSVVADYSALPEPVVATDANPLNDHYEPALVLLIMSIAYRRNTQRQDLAKSQGYFNQGMQMIGLGAQSQAAQAPRVSQGA
jgi:hypothetical protein